MTEKNQNAKGTWSYGWGKKKGRRKGTRETLALGGKSFGKSQKKGRDVQWLEKKRRTSRPWGKTLWVEGGVKKEQRCKRAIITIGQKGSQEVDRV